MGIKADLEGKRVSFKINTLIDHGGGKRHWELIENFGEFLCFGCAYESSEESLGNFSTVIILMSDGSMKNIAVEQVKFI